MANNRVELKKVSLSLDGRKVLEEVSVSFEERSLSVIFGPNGAGKTTLLKVLVGQLVPEEGSVTLFGRSVKEGRCEIGYVPQGVFSKCDFPITVIECVVMGRFGKIGLIRRPQKSDYAIAHQALSQVGLEHLENAVLQDLSGGQRQRVFIARALAGEPKLLLLDEATSGVDVGARESLYDLLQRIKKEVAVVFVTHDMSVVSRQVDQVVCLNRRLVSHGKPEVALTDEALACMYGSGVSLFSHCSTSHIHVHEHKE